MITAALALLAMPVCGQQEYVPRYDAFYGYAFLNSPHVNLFENGFATQVGFRPRRWLSFGVDYTRATGTLNLTADMLLPTLQQSLAAQLGQMAAAKLIPPGYTLKVPSHSVTQALAVGPQLAYRGLSSSTLFLRPLFMGLMHEAATPKPDDAVATAIVKQLAPSGTKTDNVLFIGFGGGFDLLFSRHLGWRVQADLVYDHLFNDLLKDGRFTVRFSTGPCFNFGRNVER